MKDLASINQVDNRTGWLESAKLQLVPTSHAQLIGVYVTNNIKKHILYLELKSISLSVTTIIMLNYVKKLSFSWIKGAQQSMVHAFMV